MPGPFPDPAPGPPPLYSREVLEEWAAEQFPQSFVQNVTRSGTGSYAGAILYFFEFALQGTVSCQVTAYHVTQTLEHLYVVSLELELQGRTCQVTIHSQREGDQISFFRMAQDDLQEILGHLAQLSTNPLSSRNTPRCLPPHGEAPASAVLDVPSGILY